MYTLRGPSRNAAVVHCCVALSVAFPVGFHTTFLVGSVVLILCVFGSKVLLCSWISHYFPRWKRCAHLLRILRSKSFRFSASEHPSGRAWQFPLVDSCLVSVFGTAYSGRLLANTYCSFAELPRWIRRASVLQYSVSEHSSGRAWQFPLVDSCLVSVCWNSIFRSLAPHRC